MSACLLILPILSAGCASKPDVQPPHLPDPTADLQDCVQETVPPIPGTQGTALNKADTISTLGYQRASALSKARCANNYNAWYLDLQKKMDGK